MFAGVLRAHCFLAPFGALLALGAGIASPARAADASLGSAGDVFFPLGVLPRARGRPVLLRFNVDYAICETLCIPADGKAELLLGEEPTAYEDALRQSEERVPKPVAIGQGEALAIAAVTREAHGEKRRVLVDVRAPDAA